MSGKLARRRMTKFMPADFKLIETRQPLLKDLYDEWLASVAGGAAADRNPVTPRIPGD